MWLVTTLEQTAPEILWEMMNRRWDIEENGFHQLIRRENAYEVEKDPDRNIGGSHAFQ